MARLGWLHLSDLHLGVHGSRLFQAEYRESFEQDLRRLHARSGPWDLILISGDLTLTGSPREFELLSSALGSLWDLLRKLGSEASLLVVPGNHDIQRGPDPSVPDLGVRHRALEARKALRGASPSKVGQALWKGFAPFNDWFSTWRHTHPSSQLQAFRPGLLPGDFAATVALKGLTVGIVGLNSNFRSSARDGLEGVNEIDVEQLEKATGQNVRAWAGQHDALLLLTHHPPSMLRKELLTELGERLAAPGRPLLHLCGSRHAEGSWLGVPLPPWSLSIHASALFSEVPSGSPEQRWGYIAGQLELTTTEGRLALFPRSSSTRNGELVLGPDARALPGARESLEIPMSELLREKPPEAIPGTPEISEPPPAPAELSPPRVTASEAPRREEEQVKPSPDKPIQILHLSDLHVDAGDDPLNLLQPLVADLQGKHGGLKVERLDHLVISGDITQKATPKEFEKAREFVSELIQHFGLTARQCIIVPGNHDLDWSTEVYTRKKKRLAGDLSKLTPGFFCEKGEDVLIRKDEKYPERFKNFSDHFYQPLLQTPYPLPPEEQCLSFLFPESRLQFLAMNSAWEIDKEFKERASISERALSKGLMVADKELARARMNGQLEKEASVLRMAVWHHPITGNQKIQDDAFMGRLSQAEVRVCLHGHVHEERVDLVNHIDPERSIHIVGAGTFGAPHHDRPESTPRLYNLLKVDRNLRRIQVHVRSRPRQGGAWGPWAKWRTETPGVMRTYYDVPLP